MGGICSCIIYILLDSLISKWYTVSSGYMVTHIWRNWFSSSESIFGYIGDLASCICIFLQTHILQYLPSSVIFLHNIMKLLAFATIQNSVIADTFYCCCIISTVHNIFVPNHLPHIHQRHSQYMSFQFFLYIKFFVFLSRGCVVDVFWWKKRFWAEETFELLRLSEFIFIVLYMACTDYFKVTICHDIHKCWLISLIINYLISNISFCIERFD